MNEGDENDSLRLKADPKCDVVAMRAAPEFEGVNADGPPL